jgi:phosphoglycolate phosphatase
VPEDEFRRLYKALLAYYGEHNAVHTRPYPGVEEALDTLAAQRSRWRSLPTSSKASPATSWASSGWLSGFVAIIGGDTLGKGRAKPGTRSHLRRAGCLRWRQLRVRR